MYRMQGGVGWGGNTSIRNSSKLSGNENDIISA